MIARVIMLIVAAAMPFRALDVMGLTEKTVGLEQRLDRLEERQRNLESMAAKVGPRAELYVAERVGFNAALEAVLKVRMEIETDFVMLRADLKKRLAKKKPDSAAWKELQAEYDDLVSSFGRFTAITDRRLEQIQTPKQAVAQGKKVLR